MTIFPLISCRRFTWRKERKNEKDHILGALLVLSDKRGREKSGFDRNNASASGWPTFVRLHQPRLSPSFASFSCFKYQIPPLGSTLFRSVTRNSGVKTLKTRNVGAGFSFSYLDQNGGEKEPGTKSSLHLYVVLGICHERKREIIIKRIIKNCWCSLLQDASFDVQSVTADDANKRIKQKDMRKAPRNL